MIIEIKQIKDLRMGEIFTDSYQTLSHARIFLSRSEIQDVKGFQFVYVSYKEPSCEKEFKAEYSADWEVWTYNN